MIAKIYRNPKKYRGHFGKRGATKTHFGEQYEVHFDDWSYCEVFLWIEHGDNEKDNHDKAQKVAENEFPGLNVHCVYYC